ncbi:filamentous hemagglutinin N-terminal domain-containing protein [Variovorax paradoxus]|uniref:two-partner secretion domain-containing protein n=1 Tax=Variovorax paradoxus TaxID=34073 RepID=UPI003D64F00B
MNKKFNRVIWSAARAMRVVVHEAAATTGKGSFKATKITTGALASATALAPMFVVAALAGLLTAPYAHAQIVANPTAPGALRPTVLVAPNGVGVINITTPSAAGVSRNQYIQFDVNGRGVIVNNARTNVQSGLGGWINGNPYLATGPARVIVNEVSSSNPSYINGPVEIAGQRAEFILANPSGIALNGGTFINSSRVTLTTGTPQFNAFGGLDAYVVRGGTVTVGGNGLDATRADLLTLISRGVVVNGGIWANDLKVVAGANVVSADAMNVTPTTGTGPAPSYAIDVAQLGGMYSGHIQLLANEAGIGVRNAGAIQASASSGVAGLAGLGQLVVTSAGRLENIGTIQATADANLSASALANSGTISSGSNLRVTTQGNLANALNGTGGTLEGQGVQLASTAGDIDNRGGTIRQTGGVALTLAAPTLSNTSGGVIGLEPAPAPTAGSGGTTGTGSTSGGTTGTGSTSGGTTTTTSGTTTTTTTAPALVLPPIEPGTITAAGAILNDGGKIYAGGPITLNTPQINNAGGALSVASIAVTGPTFSNAGGTLNVSNSFSANVGQLDNTGGTLNAGTLNIATTGDLINIDGTLTSATDAVLTVGGQADNTRGTISATGSLSANVAGAVNNTAGTLASNQALTLTGQSLNNSQGTIQSAGGNVQLSIGQQLLNTDGHIASGANLTIQTGSLEGRSGTLQSTGDLSVTAAQGLTATGTTVAGGNATLQGASVDLSGSQTGAANIAIIATQGNVTTSGATVATPGTLAVTADAQPGQTLVNSAGTLNAGQLQISVSNLANTNGGEIVQTGTGSTTLATSGTLNNDGGRIASNGQDLSLSGASITNTGGKIEHAGTGTLSIAGGSYSGSNGQITANGALAVAMAGAFNQDGGTTYAQQINLSAGSLSNQGGSLVQAGSGTTTLAVGGLLKNNEGTIASNGPIAASAGSMSNQGGTLQAAGTSDLSLTVAGPLDNSAGGKILAGGNATVAAGSLNNNAGSVTAVGDLNATLSGAATNVGGTLAANGNTTLVAGTLDNSGGTAAAVTGNLSVTTSGTTTNNGGTLQAGGATALSNGGLINQAGKVFGNSLVVDTRGNTLDNTQGTLAATTTVAISSGMLLNDAGLIQSGGTMTVNTNGQGLSNTNAAGYSNGQGGITSGDTLDLKTGAVNNAAGFIGAKNALTASTQGFLNTGGGVVLGQSTVAINTNGAGYDNSGGQTLAGGDLTINTGAGTIDNTSSLLRSGGTTTLNAGTVVNTNTLGTDQGIEGRNVVIGTGPLNNNAGAIRADVNATITSGGTVDNTNGLISAGDTLKIVDSNAATPSAKTLSLINTGGTLVADKSVQIEAAGFSGDGQLASGGDLSVSLTQDIVNNADVTANGNLSYTTTGNFTNNGKLLAGQTLTVGGNDVDNTANAEMSGTNTVVTAAGKLTNRGLIDSGGTTRLNAGVVNNIGTGRIYGNDISIAAGALLNDAETLNGVTKAGTIAARGNLDIGTTTLTNREHALIFSGGNMAIAGALDAAGKATGQGGTLNNLSATIESLGNMSLSMGQINNWDTHIQLGPKTTTSTQTVTVAPVGGSGFYTLDQVVIIPGQPFVWARNPDGSTGALLYSNGYGIWTTTSTTTADTAINADPALISSGGDMTLVGAVYNRDSRIIAGGTLTASNVTNEALKGNYQTTSFATVVNDKGQLQPIVIGPVDKGTVDVGAFEYIDHVNATSGYNAGTAATGSTTAGGGGTGSAGGGTRTGTIVEVAANVGGVAGAGGTGAGASGGASGGSGQTIPMVVRTSTPNLAVPQASLFSLHAGPGGYLIETDPRFANYRNWLSGDYLLNSLGLDPNDTLKRLGDGFYEQKLIREQVAQLTGYRYLDGFNSDEDQYTALMNAGVTFAKEYGLRPGIALTPAQMAQLTSDIVWLVEQTVTLPDGSTQRVLVPQVYVRVRPGDIDGSGALLAGNQVKIDGKDNNLVNTGTIAGRQLVSINANTIDNLGGRISGGQVGLKAQVDINNIGGTIDARDKLSLEAGRDINVRTTTASGGMGNTNVDRVAGLYVTNPGGTLVASAGRDVNLIGAVVANAGNGQTAIKAGNDINLGTVTTTTAAYAIGENLSGGFSQSREVGTRITGGGNVLLDAGHDVRARAATVAAGGDLGVKAGNDILIESGRQTTDFGFSTQWKDRGTLTSTSNSISGQAHTNTAIASSFSGNNIAMESDRDLNIVGSDVSARGDASLTAGRNVNITSALEETSATADRSRTTSGLIVPKPTDHNWDLQRNHSDHAELATQTERASNVSAGGNLTVNAGKQVNVYASNLSAGQDLGIKGQEVTILSGTNYNSATIGTSNDRQTAFVTGSPVRTGHGGGNADHMTSTREQTTLAPATLNGRNVTITATDGDVTLGAAHINAANALSLNAPQGAINFDTVTTGTRTTLQRGEHDWAYQRSRDSGSVTTEANYTQINSGTLTVDAQRINVQVGRNAAGGQEGPLQYAQTVAQVLQQQSGQPGMSWIQQIQSDPNLASVPINWQSVPLPQRQWAEGQGGLTQTGAAVITIVASIFSYGAASGWGVAAAEAAGGGAVGAAVGVAVQAGVASIASQAAVGLINHNGDIGAVLEDLGSSQGIRRIVTAMATAGVVQGLNIGLGIEGWTPGGVTAGTATWPQVLGRNLLDGAAAGLVYAGINGTSAEDAIRNGLMNGLLNTAAAGSAQWIGGNTQGMVNAIAHAIAGCAIGAGRASGGGYGLTAGDGCSAGAIGATVGHLAGQAYNPTNNPIYEAQTIQFAQIMAGVAAALVGGNQASADIGAAAGANAVANNQFSRGGAALTAANQLAQAKKMINAAADYIDQMRDVCPECSAESLRNMKIEVSPLTAAQAGLKEPNVYASFDGNKVVLYQEFTNSYTPVQLSILIHEYAHTLPSNRQMVVESSPADWGDPSNHNYRPWEVDADRIAREFVGRFGQTLAARGFQ